MKIAFIGDTECNITNMLAVALTMHSEDRRKILLVDAEFADTRLEEAFRGDDRAYIKEESYYGIREGLDYFFYRMKTTGYNPSVTKEGVTYLSSNFAYIKAAIKGDRKEHVNNIKQYMKELLNQWNEEFDIVMIKCSKFLAGESSIVIKNCDACVVNFLNEKVAVSKEKIYSISQKKLFFLLIGQVIGNCDEEQKFLTKYCRIEDAKIGLVPYDPYFDISMSRGGLLKSFKNNNNNKNQNFKSQMKETTHKLNKWLEDI